MRPVQEKAERWAHFKLMLTAQTHLMKSQLDNRWESDIIREGLRLL